MNTDQIKHMVDRGELDNIEADRAMTSLTKPKPVDPLNRDEAYSDKLADNFRGWP